MDASSAARRRLAAAKSFWKFCYNQGFKPNDIGRCLIIPRKQMAQHERILRAHDCSTIISTADGNTKLLLQVLLWLGLRLSEARTLHRSCIRKRRDGCLVFHVKGKRGKVRNVILAPRMSVEIDKALPASGYLFPGRFGGCLTRSGAGKKVSRVMKRVVKQSSAHWLRHTFASMCVNMGAPLATVAAQMGHSSVQTTTTYLHSDDAGASVHLERLL
jgi:integrase